MILERLFSYSPVVERIMGQKVYLRAAELTDHAAWASLRRKSRSFLVPWEPTWSPDDLTKAAFRYRVRRYMRDMREDLAYAYLIFATDDDALIGGVTLSNVRRGVAQTASVGYWLGEPYTGKGYMTDALHSVVEHAFTTLQLNRVEAACLPTNSSSIALLERCGFIREGYSRQYLKINGKWQDHLLFARLASD